MTTATKPATFKSDLLGTVVLTSYVDPHPGKVGTDRVAAPCSRCGGSGYFQCYGHIYGGRCFQCGGNGQGSISVATARKHARTDAFNTEYAAEIAAARAVLAEAAAVAQAAADFAADYDAAHAENAKRAAMVQGFLGQVDEKIAFTGTVKVAKYIAGGYNRSSSMFLVFTTDAGQAVSGFSSSQTVMGLERGDRVTVTAKVKKTESYQGQDQTVITAIKAAVLPEAE
jgi:hypothetical protein